MNNYEGIPVPSDDMMIKWCDVNIQGFKSQTPNTELHKDIVKGLESLKKLYIDRNQKDPT